MGDVCGVCGESPCCKLARCHPLFGAEYWAEYNRQMDERDDFVAAWEKRAAERIIAELRGGK